MRDSLRRELGAHPLFERLISVEALRRFMESHVACVWSYTAQLFGLGRELSGEGPWFPPPDAEARRLVDELTLLSQSDEIEPGRYGSHFEWYLEAMDEVGAASSPARRFVSGLRMGRAPEQALASSGMPSDTHVFLQRTLPLLSAPLHARAATFLHAHEFLIPSGLAAAVDALAEGGVGCGKLRALLARRREIERETLLLFAERWVTRLMDDDPERRFDCDLAVTDALRARRRLWDATLGALGTTTLVA